MLPFMGQGAAQSIEDGLALARAWPPIEMMPSGHRHICLTASGACGALQAASRDQGRDLQLSDAAEVAGRNTRMRESPEAPVARYDWAWGYDVDKAMDDGGL